MLQVITRSSNYKWWAFGAISVGIFNMVMDQSAAIVAIPTIAGDFDADIPTVQWILVGYALVISALLLPMGRLSDMIGLKKVYTAGFAIFVLGAVLAGISPNITMLILSRLLQGLGSAMTQGTSLAIVLSVFPGNERGKVMGLYLAMVGAGSIAGSPLGGSLINVLDWPWVFFVSAVVGGFATLAALVVLDERRLRREQRSSGPGGSFRSGFDWLGAALSAGLLTAFLLAMTSGPRTGWSSAPVIVSGAIFVALLVAFVWWELRTPSPMLDLRLFRVRVISLGALAGFIIFIGSNPVRFLMPFYLQNVLGYSPGEVGLILVPSSLCMIIMSPISGRLSDRYGWRIFNVLGMGLAASGLFILSRVSVDSPLVMPLVAMMLQNAGMSMFDTTNNSSIMGAVEQGRYGVVSGLVNLVRNAANVTGVALATAIVTAIMASNGYLPRLDVVAEGGGPGVFDAFVSGLRVTYLSFGCLLLVGMVVSFLKGSLRREAPRLSPVGGAPAES